MGLGRGLSSFSSFILGALYVLQHVTQASFLSLNSYIATLFHSALFILTTRKKYDSAKLESSASTSKGAPLFVLPNSYELRPIEMGWEKGSARDFGTKTKRYAHKVEILEVFLGRRKCILDNDCLSGIHSLPKPVGLSIKKFQIPFCFSVKSFSADFLILWGKDFP